MKKYGLDFDTPAADWLEAIPLGNGHIGVMMYGSAVCETLSLNDDTLWSGYKRDYIKKDFAENLQKVRALMLEGEKEAAQDLLESKMLGPFSQVYLPLGDIRILYDSEAVDGSGSEDGSVNAGTASNYRRHLDFASGAAHVNCEKSGSPFSISCFCSSPADVMVYRVKSPRKFSFSIEMDSQLRHDTYSSNNYIRMLGAAPSNIIIDDVYNFYTEKNIVSYEQIEKSIKFAAEVRVVTNGVISQEQGSLRVADCTYAELYYTSTTSFSKIDLQEYCRETLAAALENGYEVLEEAHHKDFADLYKRVQIDLGGVRQTTEEIYNGSKLGSVDGYAVSTLFQYGRYLLISSSRKGTQPANLQGIWNKDLIPPWWSNYTLNINLQMNYWLAERTNLSECTAPLFDFIKRLSENGKETARENYGMNGFVAHHQTDIWVQTTPVGYYNKRERDSASWAMWNMSGAWLCLHLYEHYQFTGDEHFLSDFAGPIFAGCADFLLDYLVERDGKFVTLPSTSPENLYYGPNGKRLAICISSAMDIGILKEFFTAYVDICSHLNRPEEVERSARILNNLPEYTIADDRIQEWDGNYTAVESGHRHFSMLFGVYPYSHQLDNYRIPAENALHYRLENCSGSTGWSSAWAIALLARLGRREDAYMYVRHLMQNHLHANLFGAHPPSYFQIDANLGFTAAVSEMLLQDYDGIIRPIPALPEDLPNGSVKGLKTRGGHIIDLAWVNGKIIEMNLTAGFGVLAKIALENAAVYCDGKKVKVKKQEYGIEFPLSQEKLYQIVPEQEL